MSFIEQRQDERRKTLQRAQIVFGQGQITKYCTVHDISASGAKLAVDGWFTCPDDIALKFLEGMERLALPKNCRIVWRGEDAVGVQFISA